MKAFKLACLSYKCHDISFRGMSFSRRMLFDLRRQIIDKEWQQVLIQKKFQQNIPELVPKSGDDDPISAFYRFLDSKLKTKANN